MSFDISRVLDSSMAVLDHNASGSSNQSQININANQAIRSVIEEFANQLFDDAEFLTTSGLQVLSTFQKLEVKKSDFETNLQEQLQTVAYLCHSRQFTAADEGRSLNVAESSEITQAFQHLAMAHQESEDANGLAGKLAILAEATPVVIKISEAYANYIRPIDAQLSKLLKGQGVPQNVIDSIDSYRSNLFPDVSCSKEGLQAIEEAVEAPNFGLMKYEDCLPAASNYILHLALAAQNEERGMTDSDVEATKSVIKGLRLKMGVLRQSKIHNDRIETGIKTHKKTMKQLASLPAEQTETTLAKTKKIAKLEKELGDYNYYSAYMQPFKDLKGAIQSGQNRRVNALKKAKVSLLDYTRMCEEKQVKLQHLKEIQEKEIQNKDQAWKEFVLEKYEDTSLVETGVQIFDNKYFRIGLLMENPDVVAQSALQFIGHLTSRVARQPNDEQASSWYSKILSW
jgi:hypothetical protein